MSRLWVPWGALWGALSPPGTRRWFFLLLLRLLTLTLTRGPWRGPAHDLLCTWAGPAPSPGPAPWPSPALRRLCAAICYNRLLPPPMGALWRLSLLLGVLPLPLRRLLHPHGNVAGNMADNMGGNMADMGSNMADNMGGNMADMGGNMADNMGGNMADNMADNMGGNMGDNMADNMVDNMAAGGANMAAGRTNMAAGRTNMAAGCSNMAAGRTNMAAGRTNMAAGRTNMAAGRTNMAAGGANMAAGCSNMAAGGANMAARRTNMAAGCSNMAAGGAVRNPAGESNMAARPRPSRQSKMAAGRGRAWLGAGLAAMLALGEGLVLWAVLWRQLPAVSAAPIGCPRGPAPCPALTCVLPARGDKMAALVGVAASAALSLLVGVATAVMAAWRALRGRGLPRAAILERGT